MTSRFFVNVYKHGTYESVFRGYFDVNNTTDVIEHFYDSISPAIDIIMNAGYYSTNKFKDGKFTGNGTTITSMPSVDAQHGSFGWLFTSEGLSEAWGGGKNDMTMRYSNGWWYYPLPPRPLLQYEVISQPVQNKIDWYFFGVSQKNTDLELSIVNVSIDDTTKFVDAEKLALDIIANDNLIIPNGVIYNKTHCLITDFNIANIPALDALNGATEWNITWKVETDGTLHFLSSNVFTSPPPGGDETAE
jgi:hypothetical protein